MLFQACEPVKIQQKMTEKSDVIMIPTAAWTGIVQNDFC